MIKIYLIALQKFDSDFISIRWLNETFIIAMSSLVWNPARLLGIIRLWLQLDLQLRRDHQPRGWIRVGSLTLLDMARHCLGRSSGLEEAVKTFFKMKVLTGKKIIYFKNFNEQWKNRLVIREFIWISVDFSHDCNLYTFSAPGNAYFYIISKKTDDEQEVE